jgi:DNA-binding winged helix-turn-helix (wHTH) protein
MKTVENKGVIYEFGKFVLDPQEKTLLNDGHPVHLPAKEFDTYFFWLKTMAKPYRRKR